METRYYEGCAREGPIRCIFLAEFHSVAGPRVACQFPEEYMSKEYFDTINTYIIPKPQLQRHSMTINALGHKVIGYPIMIENERFERNAYLFNICFICDSWSRTAQYEPVVKKLGEHLCLLEEESRFITEGQSRLPTFLAHILHDLNTHRESTILEGDTVLHLKVIDIREDPPLVADHDVPVIISSIGLPRPEQPQSDDSFEGPSSPTPCQSTFNSEVDKNVFDKDADWDLTTRQLIPFINGYNHVLKIAAVSNMDKELVKSCIRNLIYFGMVSLVPILKYSNMYRTTPAIGRMFNDPELQQACLNYISQGLDEHDKYAFQPKLVEVQKILCSLKQGTTLRDVSDKLILDFGCKFDIKRLIIFALLHELIVCLRRYPVYLPAQSTFHGTMGEGSRLRKYLNGMNSDDEICCKARVDLPTLDKFIESDPAITVIWK